MRKGVIFLYFLFFLTMALRNGDWIGALVLLVLFLPCYSYSEEFDHDHT
jgi:hypothetical protein